MYVYNIIIFKFIQVYLHTLNFLSCEIVIEPFPKKPATQARKMSGKSAKEAIHIIKILIVQFFSKYIVIVIKE